MRLLELFRPLLEYKRDITVQKLGDKLVAVGKKDGNRTLDEILDILEQIDPTKNKQYVQWLATQYLRQQFRLEDASRVQEVLRKFEGAKTKLQQKDINRYSFYSLDDEMDKVYNVELKTDAEDENVKDAKILYKGPLGQLSIPLTREASCALGSGTKWCTAGKEDNMFDYYNREGPLFIWKDKNGKKYQFHFQSGQFMDDKDHPISDELFKYFREQHPITSKAFKMGEEKISQDAYDAYEYAYEVLHKRFPVGEPAIAQDYLYSERYMYNVLNSERFPELEKVLLARGNVPDMIKYVENVKGQPRIPEIEEAILQSEDPGYALQYARKVISSRWPPGEKLIASDPHTALVYAMIIIDGRWPMGEKAIARSSYESFEYAKRVLGEPFDAGESAIAEDPQLSLKYALTVLGAPFPEGEFEMRRDPTIWKDYIKGMRDLEHTIEQ